MVAPNPTGYSLSDWRKLGSLRQVSDRQLFVLDSGTRQSPDRPVVVLIHGFPTASWDWHHQWDALASHYRVIGFDMLGFGFSDKPSGHRYSIHEQADLAEQLLSDLGVEAYAILAHDYGDTVAQELLARDTESSKHRIRAACLLNGGLFPETHRARMAQKLLVGPAGGIFVKLFNRGTLEKNLISVFGPDTPPGSTELAHFWDLISHNDGQRNLHRLMWYMKDRIEHRTRWITALTSTRAELALINGSFDPVSGSHMVARYRELVGKGDILELPDIGHYPQLEAPGRVTSSALAFFDKVMNPVCSTTL